MMEILVPFILVVAGLNVALDIGEKTYDYVEPKVKQGVEYIQEKMD